jgi:hypothetical protein
MPICSTPYCQRKAKHNKCYHCQTEAKKLKNPYRYWFGVLRRNARRRGVFFGLSFDYWVKWCDDTGYLALKGRSRDSASIDRIINELGYIDGNIQLLTVSNNSQKGAKKITWNYITHTWELQPAVTIYPNDEPNPF